MLKILYDNNKLFNKIVRLLVLFKIIKLKIYNIKLNINFSLLNLMNNTL
jgi:hypothetical protein